MPPEDERLVYEDRVKGIHPVMFGIRCNQCGWFVAFVDASKVHEGLLPVNQVWNWVNRGYTVVPLADNDWVYTAVPCSCVEAHCEHGML